MRHHKHDDDSNTAVLDRPTAQDPAAEAKRRQEERDEIKRKELIERNKKPSGGIYRVAADELEQSTKRPRDIIEQEVASASSNEVQAALLRAIIMHLDGDIPKYEAPPALHHDKSDVVK